MIFFLNLQGRLRFYCLEYSWYLIFFLFLRLSDNLPCATQFKIKETGEDQYEHGYKLGFTMNEKVCKIDPKQRSPKIRLFHCKNGQSSYINVSYGTFRGTKCILQDSICCIS